MLRDTHCIETHLLTKKKLLCFLTCLFCSLIFKDLINYFIGKVTSLVFTWGKLDIQNWIFACFQSTNFTSDWEMHCCSSGNSKDHKPRDILLLEILIQNLPHWCRNSDRDRKKKKSVSPIPLHHASSFSAGLWLKE